MNDLRTALAAALSAREPYTSAPQLMADAAELLAHPAVIAALLEVLAPIPADATHEAMPAWMVCRVCMDADGEHAGWCCGMVLD